MEDAEGEAGAGMETLDEVDEEKPDVNMLLNLHEKRIANLESEVAAWRQDGVETEGNHDNASQGTDNVGPTGLTNSPVNSNTMLLGGTADSGTKPSAVPSRSRSVFSGSVAKTDPTPLRPQREVHFFPSRDAKSEIPAFARRRLPRRQEVSKVAKHGRPLTGSSGIGKDTVRILRTDPYLHVLDATYPELRFEVETLEAKLHYHRHKDDKLKFGRAPSIAIMRREGTLTVPRSFEFGRDTTLGSLYKQQSLSCQHELSSESSSVEEAQVAILREKIYTLQTELAEYGSDDSDVDENFY